MINLFLENFHKASKQKNSLLVAGIDTATSEFIQTSKVQTTQKYYPSATNKLDFSIAFVKSIMDFCVAVKINLGYWQDQQDGKKLQELIAYCKQKELLVLLDGKYSDIGSSNKAWIFYAQKLGVDAITIAPFAGNCLETTRFCHQQKLAVFTMGLMSNPEFQNEMNFQNQQGIKLYEQRTLQALAAGVDGFVLGATYPSASKEVRHFLQLTKNEKSLYLIPGLGTQNGSIENLRNWQIDFTRCLISLSRALMFPSKRDFSAQKISDRQKQAAKFYHNSIQKYR